jgi:hypothetical protein
LDIRKATNARIPPIINAYEDVPALS